jgi:hypothetical protein
MHARKGVVMSDCIYQENEGSGLKSLKDFLDKSHMLHGEFRWQMDRESLKERSRKRWKVGSTTTRNCHIPRSRSG